MQQYLLTTAGEFCRYKFFTCKFLCHVEMEGFLKCSVCHQSFPEGQFSSAQKKKGPKRKCTACSQDAQAAAEGKRLTKLAQRSNDPQAQMVSLLPKEVTNAQRQLVQSCNHCKKPCSEEVKLSVCSACKKARYCSSACQRAHWPEHKPFCIKPPATVPTKPIPDQEPNPRDVSKICRGCLKLVPQIDWKQREWDTAHLDGRCCLCRDPNYVRPRAAPSSQGNAMSSARRKEIGGKQHELQRERAALLHAALTKSFNLRHSAHTRLAPVSYTPNSPADMKNLQQLDLYEVVWHDKETNLKDSCHFKFIGVGEYHACDLMMEVAGCLQDERFEEGGIHYLIGAERAFWSLIMNWHNYGTSLPFPGPCGNKCAKSPQMKADWLKLQKKYDAIFQTALDNRYATRCMFVDTPFGCLDLDCPFAH